MSKPSPYAFVCIIFIALFLCLSAPTFSQQMTSLDRETAQIIFRDISGDIQKHYYDPKFHGIDWQAKINETKQKINESPNLNTALMHIAAALDSLNDSHVFFLPPSRPYRLDFGYELEMIGDRCFVVQVRPGSSVEKTGLKPGDQVLTINGFALTRDSLSKIEYLSKRLSPQSVLHVTLQHPDGQKTDSTLNIPFKQKQKVRDLTGDDIWALFREDEAFDHLYRARYLETPDDVFILKFPEFAFSESEISSMIGKVRKHKSFILDLRGNGGGAETTLKSLLSGVLDHEVKIGDTVGRDKSKPITAKSGGGGAFKGKLVVLVDSESASASELFARVVQLEKRGVVIGDHSAGKVMRAQEFSYHVGIDTVSFFGASITDADLIMTDGKSLEHTGVTPDELLIPTAEDLAAGRDPVMARAIEIAGGTITPEKAGSLFPYEWPPQQ